MAGLGLLGLCLARPVGHEEAGRVLRAEGDGNAARPTTCEAPDAACCWSTAHHRAYCDGNFACFMNKCKDRDGLCAKGMAWKDNACRDSDGRPMGPETTDHTPPPSTASAAEIMAPVIVPGTTGQQMAHVAEVTRRAEIEAAKAAAEAANKAAMKEAEARVAADNQQAQATAAAQEDVRARAQAAAAAQAAEKAAAEKAAAEKAAADATSDAMVGVTDVPAPSTASTAEIIAAAKEAAEVQRTQREQQKQQHEEQKRQREAQKQQREEHKRQREEAAAVAAAAGGVVPGAAEAGQSFIPTTCAQCGYDEKGVASCCSHGGSWQGNCRDVPTRNGQHTFAEGYEICHGDAEEPSDARLGVVGNATHRNRQFWSVAELSRLYKHGMPSNNLSQVGLMVHCFDDTEEKWKPWKPCVSGFCSQFEGRWSTSIIAPQQHGTYSGSGILMNPLWTKVLCSHWADMGSMVEGCNVEKGTARDHSAPTEKENQMQRELQQREQRKQQIQQRDEDRRAREAAARERSEEHRTREVYRTRSLPDPETGTATQFRRAEEQQDGLPLHPFPPEELKNMLVHSYYNNKNSPMNEVLVDTRYYLDHLPESAAAIFFFHDASTYERVVATRAYVGMLDAYNLTESQFHLLKINHRCVNLMGENDVMTDESAGARHFLATHPYGRFAAAHDDAMDDARFAGLRRRPDSDSGHPV